MDAFESRAPLLPEILALHGRWRRGREAVVCGSRREHWDEFAATLHRFGGALHAHGVGARDRVAVLMSNGLPMVHALFGTLDAGAVSVPLNTSISDDALLAMLRDAGASAIVATADQRPRIDALRDRLGSAARLYLLADGAAPGWVAWAPAQPMAAQGFWISLIVGLTIAALGLRLAEHLGSADNV